MPVVNLDVVAPVTVDITRGETVWKLAPDVPAAVMVRVLYLGELQAQNVAEDLAAFAEAQGLSLHDAIGEWQRREEERQAAIEAETLRIFAGIWRWTYPDASDEWLRTSFSHRERFQIVDAFFEMRSPPSAAAPNESTPSLSATASFSTTATPAATPTQPNRAERRARQSSKAAPSTARTRSATRSWPEPSPPRSADQTTSRAARMTATAGVGTEVAASIS